jgi:hypothetical protein
MSSSFSETESVDRTPVAKDIFTYCTKEKIDTWHVVMHHDSKGIVDRVMCKACRSEHKYKKKTAAKAAPTSRSTLVRKVVSPAERSKVMSQGSFEEDWFKGVKSWGQKEVHKYDPKRHFALKEVLNHEVFGKGVVKGRRENKIDVLFQNGLKVLPSPRKPMIEH